MEAKSVKQKDYGNLFPGRILIRQIKKPDHMMSDGEHGGKIAMVVGTGKKECASASQWGLVLACAQLYMVHQGQFERGEIPGWPIPAGTVIEVSLSNQWDVTTNSKNESYVLASTVLRSLPIAHPELPDFVKAQLREWDVLK